MKFLDKYGGKPTPPSMKPKSWAGAIISVLIYSVVLAIISLNVAKVYRSYVRGEVAFVQLPHSVIFNAVPDEKGVKDFWDIPPLDFKVSSLFDFIKHFCVFCLHCDCSNCIAFLAEKQHILLRTR